MKKQIAAFGMIFLILILCPYIVTLVWTGKVEGIADQQEMNSGRVIIDDQKSMTAVDFEEFLIGVVAAQIPADYEAEALRAQAVIARTWLDTQMGGQTEAAASSLEIPHWDIGECKKQWGAEYTTNYEKIKAAVQSTAGMVLRYNGGQMSPMFHAASSGQTRSGGTDYPYLVPVSSAKDVEMEGYLNVTTWTSDEFADRLGLAQREGIAESIQIVERDDSGYVKSLQIFSQSFTGEAFQSALELPSTCFTIENFEGNFRIICKGIGHGYGLSQWGADKLAKEGLAAEEILTYYYKNIELISE